MALPNCLDAAVRRMLLSKPIVQVTVAPWLGRACSPA
jgi:hypothetical protein